MTNRAYLGLVLILIVTLAVIAPTSTVLADGKKPLTLQDMMKFRQIHGSVISDNGRWVAYEAKPDRGDGEVLLHSAKGKTVNSIERGSKPVFSHDAQWVVATVLPKAVELEKSKKDKDEPKNGLALLNTATGDTSDFKKVESFVFSEDSKWLVFQHFEEEDKKDKDEKKDTGAAQEKAESSQKKKGKKKQNVGRDLIVRHLVDAEQDTIPFVLSFAFDSTVHYLAYAVSDTSGAENGLYYIDLLSRNSSRQAISTKDNGYFADLSWNNKRGVLAFLSGVLNDKGKPDSCSLWVWDPVIERPVQAVAQNGGPEDWIIPAKNELTWTRDGERLFFGLKPEEEIVEDTDEEEEEDSTKQEIHLYDIDLLLEKREVDVWHWNDPRIIPNQKKRWEKEKDRTYRAVYHLDAGRYVALADQAVPDVRVSQNPRYALGVSDVPYRRLTTWDGSYSDCYLVDLSDGSRKKVISRLRGSAQLSPGGRYMAYYNEQHWHLYDCESGITRNLTAKLDVPFFNEDHDYPFPAPSYGIAGWTEGDSAVLIYDKFDVWQFATDSGDYMNLTDGEGRRNDYTFRIQRLDPKAQFFKRDEELLLSAYHNHKKHYGFYSCEVGKTGANRLIEEKKRFRYLAKAKDAEVLMYTRESYTEFPNIWISDTRMRSRQKVSNLNPQIDEYAWGSPELVEWNSMDGVPLQGVLIKPGKFEPGKRYPVLVYFYRFFSQRLHEFNQVVINHRPCFPYYASNEYAIFLPDIRFEVGRPGFSATKCIVPGVQKLIDMGIADPGAVALHGHSWSGYQTAFVITQTNIFACAIAGAPVSNMTSAYSGIRWGSGLARQFQYEQSQSRIGGSLWNSLDRYVENSPVFYADRINTPLLIMFGDEDGAVPWYQGIELYLAMRRLGKECVFLQYQGEPHHPKKYPNKLDYTIKMKEYLDYHLKGAAPVKWIVEGVPYRGK